MDFSNVQIKRIVIHEIFTRGTQKEIIEPRYGTTLSILDEKGLEVLEERIVNAVGSDSNSLEMEIVDFKKDSCVDIINELIYLNDNDFIENSKKIALKLAESQTTRKIPGGVVVIVQGTVGSSKNKNFISIIKAEIHSGFTRSNQVILQFISELLLTPQQKLYKIAAFVEENNDTTLKLSERFSLTVYDHNMKRAETKDAATYFYEAFLGSNFKRNSKIVTRDFYEHTKNVINELPISDEEILDINMSLYTYIKSNVNSTISTDEFANEYIQEAYRDTYKNKMFELGIPETAINKDIKYLENRLKQRRIKFTNDISISGPAENFKEKIKLIESTPDLTILEIRGKIKEQQ